LYHLANSQRDRPQLCKWAKKAIAVFRWGWGDRAEFDHALLNLIDT